MGVFSKYLRFREAGEEANVNNVQEYGQPVRSLFTSSKVFTIHKKTEITDDRENVVYRSWTKFPSLHDKTDVTDAEGNQVAHIERKLLTLHERHFITMADGTSFQLSNELWHIIKDISNIEGLGWVLRGNIAALNFQLWDAEGNIIATGMQSPALMATTAAEYADRFLKGDGDFSRKIPIAVDLVTSSNVKDYLK